MRGDGTVFQRGRFWHYVFWVDGLPVQGSTGVEVAPTSGGTDAECARRVLAQKREAAKRGDEVPHEERLTLTDLRTLLRENYEFKKNRSLHTALSTFKHVTGFFGERAKATRIGTRIEQYVSHRRPEGAAEGSIRIELSLLNRAFRLAVKKKRLSPRSRPDIELPPTRTGQKRRGPSGARGQSVASASAGQVTARLRFFRSASMGSAAAISSCRSPGRFLRAANPFNRRT